jgi:hypothetical protein
MHLSNKLLFLLRLRYIALGLIPAGWWEKTQMQKLVKMLQVAIRAIVA